MSLEIVANRSEAGIVPKYAHCTSIVAADVLSLLADRLRLGLYKLDAEGRKTVRAGLGRVFGVVVENGNRSSERYRDAVDMQVSRGRD